jgi:hypothetical protein
VRTRLRGLRLYYPRPEIWESHRAGSAFWWEALDRERWEYTSTHTRPRPYADCSISVFSTTMANVTLASGPIFTNLMHLPLSQPFTVMNHEQWPDCPNCPQVAVGKRTDAWPIFFTTDRKVSVDGIQSAFSSLSRHRSNIASHHILPRREADHNADATLALRSAVF